MATKSMVSYWDGDSWEDFDDSSGVSQLFDLSIVDTVGTSRRAVATIINNSSNPQANSGASAKGPFTGVLGNFTPIKIRDISSGEIYFYGATTSVEDEFSVSDGMYLVVEAVDYLFELRAQNTLGDVSFRQIANDRALVATLNEALDSSETEITVTDTSELFIGMRITFAGNDEDMIITEINSGTSIDVVRGVNGEFDTHSSGAAMFEAATPVYAFSPKTSNINDLTEEVEIPYGSRGGLIKSFIDRRSENIRHTGPSVQVNEAIDSSETELTVIDSTGMYVGQILKVDSEEMLVTAVTDKTTITVEREYRGTTAATHSDKAILQAVDDRWTESVRNYPKNGLLKLASQGKKSILNHIREHSNAEPHYAASADQNEFGYDYYLSPNFTSTGNVLPNSFLDYFKRGTRPTSETLGPAAFGLNMHFPSPDTITNGQFVETGRQIPVRQSKIHRPQSETYTDLTAEFNTTSRGEAGNAITTRNTENFELIEVYNVNGGSDFAGFQYAGLNFSGGVVEYASDLSALETIGSAEKIRKAMTQINMGSGFSAGATSLTVDSTADMYVGQSLNIGFPGEEILITSINSSTNLTVQRAQNGTPDGDRADDSYIFAIVGTIQYITSGTNGVSNDPAVETAHMLISDVDQALSDSTVIWGTSTAAPALNLFFGAATGFLFNLKAGGRPRIAHGVRKTRKMTISGTVDPDTIREIVTAELLRLQVPPVRADVQTLYPAHFYIDNVPSAVSGSGTAEITVGNTLLTGTLNEGLDTSETGIDVTDSAGMYVGQRIKIDSEEFAITAVNSKTLITATRAQNSTSAAEHTSGAAIYDSNVDLTKYGFRTGMTINELDSDGLPTSTYGYATWVSSTKVKVTWSTGSVSTSSTLRYYIPVRAGDNVRVRSDVQNYDDTMTVTGTEYIEGTGGTSTRYNLVQKSAYMPTTYSSSPLAGVVEETDKEEALPETPEFSADPNIIIDFQSGAGFNTTSASQLDWSAGIVQVGSDRFPFNAGSTGALETLNSDGRIYYIYYKKGEPELRTIDDGDWAALVQENNNSDFKLLGEVNYDLPHAVFREDKNVVLSKDYNTFESDVIVSDNFYGNYGVVSKPAYSFAPDSDTGFYYTGTPDIRVAIGGSYRFNFSQSGLVAILSSSGVAGNAVHQNTSTNMLFQYTSSERYKKNIVDTALDSSKVYNLRPVDYETNKNSIVEGEKGFGLIAEEVNEFFPELVIYDKEGKPNSLSYDRLSVVLLMEIKKLKKEIEKLKENK